MGISFLSFLFEGLSAMGDTMGQLPIQAEPSNWDKYASNEEKNNWERTKRAVAALGLFGGVVAAPTLYAIHLHSKKMRKKPLSEKDRILGVSLEQTSAHTKDLLLTTIAAPAIALPLAMWLIEIGENFPRAKYDDLGTKIAPRGIYSGTFGDRMQTLVGAAVAAPIIGGLAGMAGSAFNLGAASKIAKAGK